MRRIIGALMVVALLSLTGCSAKQVVEQFPVAGKKADLKAGLSKAAGVQADKYYELAGGFLVVGTAENDQRAIAYVLKDGDGYRVLGHSVKLAKGADVRTEGELVVAEYALQGSPKHDAYRVEKNGLTRVNYYKVKAPDPAVKKGHFVLVNKHWNVMWHYNDGKLVESYMVATGRQTEGPSPTWQDYKTNFFTPEGTFKLTNFAVNPPYNALKPGDKSFAGGAPGNPLGTRWMGFPVLDGDNAWVWGVHGTSEPDKIGTWASDGCIRMNTHEAEALFAQLKGQDATIQVVGKL